MFLGALIAIISIDVSLVPIVLVMVPIIGLLVWYIIVRSNVLYDAVQGRIDRLNTVLQENIQGAEVIKAFVRQDYEIERFDEAAGDLTEDATTVNQLVAMLFPTLIMISSLGIAAVIWIGGGNVIDGTLTRGDLVAFIQFMSLVAMPMMFFAFLQPMISAAAASMNRIGEVLDARPMWWSPKMASSSTPTPPRSTCSSTTSASSTTRLAETKNCWARTVHCEACRCTFPAVESGHPRRHRLGQVDARAPHPPLVRRDPRHGARRRDRRVRAHEELAATQHRHRPPAALSVQRNGARESAVRSARRHRRRSHRRRHAAQAHDFIMEMPDGYDSKIEQGGSNLSGGQRQRLSIARTLVVQPKILIFDDSTSAVDLETEARIQEVFEQLDGVTVILVAQRISTALGADEIIVLDNGHVSASGTHAELLETAELYQEIYTSQLGEPVA